MRAGIVGQVFVLDTDGHHTEARGDLFVMAEDVTPRPPGQPPAVPEVWHFDPVTLRKLRTKDERLGDCYALFLPYPPNWKDVSQIRVSTQYKPKGDPAKEPTLPGQPQVLTLDFTPPGQQASVWLDKGTKVTGPVEMKAMPNVARDLARGGLTAPHTGGTPLGVPNGSGTVLAGGTPPPAPPAVMPGAAAPPAGGPIPPQMGPAFAPPGGATSPPQSGLHQATPQLPPPMPFTPDRPQATVAGPNGEPLKVTAMALPPGQSVPDGWRRQHDGSIQQDPARGGVVQTGGTQQPQHQPTQGWTPPAPAWTTPAAAPQQGHTPQSANYQPASAGYVPASQRHQSRIQHGAIGQTPPQGQPGVGQSAPLPSLPPLPATAVLPPRTVPPVTAVPGGNVPAVPTAPTGVSGPYNPPLPPTYPPTAAHSAPAPAGGPWGNPPTTPIQPPPQPAGGVVPTLHPPPADGPIMPVVLPGGVSR
jgi:hypothetical protein